MPVMDTKPEVMNTEYTLTINEIELRGTQTAMEDASADNVSEKRYWSTNGKLKRTVTARDNAVTITGDADTSDPFYSYLLSIVDQVGAGRTASCALSGPGVTKTGTCDLTNITGVGLPSGEAGEQAEYKVDVAFHWGGSES